MRVSEKQRYNLTESRIAKTKAQNAKQLETISTQQKILRLSDDPIGAGQAIREKSTLKDIQQYTKNLEYSKGYIERTETSLVAINDFLMRAKELAVSLSNATYGDKARGGAAGEVREIIDAVVALGNTAYAGRYVFGGFRTRTPPVNSDGQFLGDDGAIFLQIDDNSFRQINIQARELFEPDPQERQEGRFGMIPTLEILHDGLKFNDIQKIRKGITELDFQLDKASSYQAILGSIYNALESAIERQEHSEIQTTERLSNITDADTYKATSDFKKTETVLQSTLLASNKLLQPSLLNFLQ